MNSLVKNLIESDQRFIETVGEFEIRYADTLENDDSGFTASYVAAIEHQDRYTSVIVLVDERSVITVPGTLVCGWSSASEAAAACMMFKDAVRAVRAYDSLVEKIRHARKLRQDADQARLEVEEELKPQQERDRWRAQLEARIEEAKAKGALYAGRGTGDQSPTDRGFHIHCRDYSPRSGIRSEKPSIDDGIAL